ncbi:DUF6902 family protein [Pontibaca methylaminivorans]|uniref:DUF6902 family protein n=1 Tax=Pontibaca methylaminivorans TaxID=515897 RepID=UPI002FD8CFD3
MSNVIRLATGARYRRVLNRGAALIETVAVARYPWGDLPWLRENAALLAVLGTIRLRPERGVLDLHEPFHATLEQRLGFFPHHYRLLLSICLDLEDLGLPGNKGEVLAHWAAREGLADRELSDLHRLGAQALLLRRGIDPLPEDGGLEDRVRAFIDRSHAFALPDVRAARCLTRIVLHLSARGRRDPGLSPAAGRSLEHAGLLAYLDQDAALLAEVCIAFRLGGLDPPPAWEGWLIRETAAFAPGDRDPGGWHGDDYRGYLLCNWAMASSGRRAFADDMAPGRAGFRRTHVAAGPLRAMSDLLWRMGDLRSDDWEVMRPRIAAALDERGLAILAEAERSSRDFASFFAGFARIGLRGVRL